MIRIPGTLLRIVGLIGLPLLLAGFFAVQITTIYVEVLAPIIELPLCTTGSLHNNPETRTHPLVRDFLALKLLLNDPVDRFDAMHKIYEGALLLFRITAARIHLI